MAEKKHMKLGIAALAVSALIIGLSVGISQSNKNRSSAAASSSANGISEADFDDEVTCSSKSSKTSKATHSSGSKSSKSHSSYDKDGDVMTTTVPTTRRKLVVPGTEDYERVNLGLGSKMNTRRGERDSFSLLHILCMHEFC